MKDPAPPLFHHLFPLLHDRFASYREKNIGTRFHAPAQFIIAQVPRPVLHFATLRQHLVARIALPQLFFIEGCLYTPVSFVKGRLSTRFNISITV